MLPQICDGKRVTVFYDTLLLKNSHISAVTKKLSVWKSVTALF
jgi:hypothetical protein